MIVLVISVSSLSVCFGRDPELNSLFVFDSGGSVPCVVTSAPYSSTFIKSGKALVGSIKDAQ